MARIVYDGDYPADYTHAEKMAEWDRWILEGEAELRRIYWKAAGRPNCDEREYLPRRLWRNKEKVS